MPDRPPSPDPTPGRRVARPASTGRDAPARRTGWPVLALVVAVVLVVLAGSFALVYRDAGGRSDVSLTDGRPHQRPARPTPSDSPSSTATPSAAPSQSAQKTAQKTAQEAARKAAVDQAVTGRQAALTKLASKAQGQSQKLKEAAENPSATFVFAQFNVQGSSHRGDVGARSRKALILLDGSGASVASLQEFAPANRRAFFGATNAWAEASLGVKPYEADNAVIWRSDTWSLVKAETRTYPYFGGAQRRMPRVLLENKQTGAQVWFTSYHNAASCCGHANSEKWRRIAVDRQVADANALRAATKQPLIVAGDMNDRRTYFCAMAPRTGMHSADGSTAGGGCRVAPRPWIDWVMGTADVAFSGYNRNDGGLADAASDHPFISTTVTVGG